VALRARPQKGGGNAAKIAFLWLLCGAARQDLTQDRDTPWVPPLAYKYPEIFRQGEKEVLG